MDWLVKHWFLKFLAKVYGYIVVFGFVVLATLDKSFLRRPTNKDRALLKEAQRKYWSLDEKPFGASHKFFELKDSRKLHYLEKLPANGPANGPGRKNLTVFIHGFPDSWPVWRRQIASPRLSKDSILVAVDLPCYGGSDDFSSMGAVPVLEAMTEFLLGMREKYLGNLSEDDGKLIVVTHDWGSVIGFRLAAEASQLADRFIICSVLLPALSLSNIANRVASARRMFTTFLHAPTKNLRLLRTALTTMSPLLTQLNRSGYIFAFNLPAPMTAWIGRMGDAWFLRLMHRLAFTGSSNVSESYTPAITPTFASEALACSFGPGIDQCHPPKSVKSDLAYSESVARRIPDGGWGSKLRIYQHGLAALRWEKSLETIVALNALEAAQYQSAVSARTDAKMPSPTKTSAARERRRSSNAAKPLFESAPRGALKAPATIVYGLQDPAFDSRVALEGMKDYLVPGSQVVIVEKAGHWVSLEEGASEVLERILGGYLKGEDEGVESVRGLAAGGKGPAVRVTVDL